MSKEREVKEKGPRALLVMHDCLSHAEASDYTLFYKYMTSQMLNQFMGSIHAECYEDQVSHEPMQYSLTARLHFCLIL